MLIGLRDVSIRLNATLFCLRTAALYQHCARVRRLPATRQLMPSSEIGRDALIWWDTSAAGNHMGSERGSNCIFRVCLEQLVAPDKWRFPHRKLQPLRKSQLFRGLKIDRDDDSCKKIFLAVHEDT